jgi:two-component system, cell cycle response regulator DivK
VVEDQPDNRQIIRDMLAPTDYEITEAEDGQQALEAIAKKRPDLILMDIQLPIIDGYTATRKIKADPAMRSIPIIPSPLMRLAGRRRRRARQAAMITFRSPSARVNYWRKSGNTCPSAAFCRARAFSHGGGEKSIDRKIFEAVRCVRWGAPGARGSNHQARRQ